MNNGVRAIIIEDGKVLLMHRFRDGQEYWVFPGGGAEESDINLEEALKRECLEEIGVEVSVGDLFFKKPSLAPKTMGRMELFYNCKIIGGIVGSGTGPEWTGRDIKEYGTYEIIWLNLNEIKDKNVYPLELRDKISTI